MESVIKAVPLPELLEELGKIPQETSAEPNQHNADQDHPNAPTINNLDARCHHHVKYAASARRSPCVPPLVYLSKKYDVSGFSPRLPRTFIAQV
jgi:hypothetical protein